VVSFRDAYKNILALRKKWKKGHLNYGHASLCMGISILSLGYVFACLDECISKHFCKYGLSENVGQLYFMSSIALKNTVEKHFEIFETLLITFVVKWRLIYK